MDLVRSKSELNEACFSQCHRSVRSPYTLIWFGVWLPHITKEDCVELALHILLPIKPPKGKNNASVQVNKT